MRNRFQWIELKNVKQNNLKNISLKLPRDKFIVITGVSGSGKSTLAFDVIHGEGRRKYLENLNTQARKLVGKLEKPKVDSIKNLSPTLALSQQSFGNNPRSTVGTLTEIYDYLRLFYARLGKSTNLNLKVNQSLFSFNSPVGACPNCNGLGVEDKIDPGLLLENPAKSIRDQCFKITNPKGYIIYSQVTIDALNEVCKAHGFSVDIPWQELTVEQKDIVLNGSGKIKIPYGKHTLESRMRWSGITAKPREKGYYKGILPVMDQILKRVRNPNILRFAKTRVCTKCHGSRLSEDALSVKINDKSITELSGLSLEELAKELQNFQFNNQEKEIAGKILKGVFNRIKILSGLGLAYLSLDRKSETLSGGELQRIQLSKLVSSKLRNITFIFDEPTIGVHPANNSELIKIIRKLVSNGNTAIVVEHDTETIQQADWIVEVGPAAGLNGGEILFNGPQKDFRKSKHNSLTRSFLNREKEIHLEFEPKLPLTWFGIKNASINNLKNISPKFVFNGLNVITGVSGAGKSSLIKQTLVPLFFNKYFNQLHTTGNPELSNFSFRQLIFVDRSPIGKTARSTPATYTKLFDLIRDLFASLESAKLNKFSKSTFSFNVKGGRCEKCEGAGKLEVGMHFLGNVETLCPDCNGKRFRDEVLNVKYNGIDISEILELSVNQAFDFFQGKLKIRKYLEVLKSIGLGYLKLGQSSGTLSGGEAQRVKLATEIIKSGSGKQLYVFDEPTTGLHLFDIQVLLDLFRGMLDKGHTLVVIEHNQEFIRIANHIIDLGPGSAEKGGEIVFEGPFKKLPSCKRSLTAKFLDSQPEIFLDKTDQKQLNQIVFTGITTNNLKSVNVAIPENKHTVITGKSGSGKSSLAFDTLFAESQNRFIESFPSYVRRFAGKLSQAKFETVEGLTPALALKQGNRINDPRSTVGTLTEIFDHYRLLFSRFGKTGMEAQNKTSPEHRKASLFSFNNSEGSCATCSGLGYVLTSRFSLLVENENLSFEEGALKNHKSLRFYTEPFGQYMATLHTVGIQNGVDYKQPVKSLNQQAIDVALFGSGNIQFDVNWKFNRKGRIGNHRFTATWKGFTNLLLEEYYRKHANGKGGDLKAFLTEKTCPDCFGQRFNEAVLAVQFCGHSIHSLAELSILDTIKLFANFQEHPEKFGLDKSFGTGQGQILSGILSKLQSLKLLGLEYLSINRQSRSLSGGELQRVLLSTHLKGGLSGLTYVLDEPSTGLHPSDAQKLNDVIKQIVSGGNTVVTVEHNPEIIKNADHILEIGPGAGSNGGEVTAVGTVKDIKMSSSETAKILSEKIKIEPLLTSDKKNKIKILGASAHNLKSINVDLIKNCLNVISGVSGSGKTSLIQNVLLPSFRHKQAVNCLRIDGLEAIQFINWIDKDSLSGSAISTPATYTGVFEPIRKLFAGTESAKSQKLKASDFSFNAKSGQCPVCKGQGSTSIKLDFISDVESVCDTCNGKRYLPHILEVKFKTHNILDVLEFSIEQAKSFFHEHKNIRSILEILTALGLGYLKLGQRTSTLSGGEAQRLKIARAILSNEIKSGLFVFDEPSRGLHPTDTHFLTNLFEMLISKGNTVVVIEHNPHIICMANHIIDLGPGGGEHGGNVIYQGEVSGLVKSGSSMTGKYLANLKS
ncbi:MAG: ATP-binding cassette domain-containing protein [Bacteroidales bacterium]|nr:ATP-binding cassette domain-containing protein [Bacteroidales bacterium]